MNDIKNLLLDMYLEEKNYAKALQYLESQLTGSIKDDYCYYKMIKIYLDIYNNVAEAKKIITKINIKNDKYFYYNGKIEALLGNLNEAIFNLKQVDNEYYEKSLLIIAKIKLYQGNYEQSKETLDRIKKTSKFYPSSRLLKSKNFALQNNFNAAHNVLNKSTPADILFKIHFLLKENRIKEAIELFNQKESILKEMPKHQEFKNILKTIYIDECDIYAEKQDAILNHIKKHEHQTDDPTHSFFNENFSSLECLEYCQEKLKDLNIYDFNYFDKYMITFPEHIGICKGVKTKKVKVITHLNNKKIKTIYPVLSQFN